MSPHAFLLQFKSREELSDFSTDLALHSAMGLDRFEPWHPNSVIGHDGSWIRLYGIPAHAWFELVIVDIGQHFGKVVQVDSMAGYGLFQVFARVKIILKPGRDLSKVIELKAGQDAYLVFAAIEDAGGELRSFSHTHPTPKVPPDKNQNTRDWVVSTFFQNKGEQLGCPLSARHNAPQSSSVKGSTASLVNRSLSDVSPQDSFIPAKPASAEPLAIAFPSREVALLRGLDQQQQNTPALQTEDIQSTCSPSLHPAPTASIHPEQVSFPALNQHQTVNADQAVSDIRFRVHPLMREDNITTAGNKPDCLIPYHRRMHSQSEGAKPRNPTIICQPSGDISPTQVISIARIEAPSPDMGQIHIDLSLFFQACPNQSPDRLQQDSLIQPNKAKQV
ncbi:uncharacterized protein LOC131256819 [Magnolia sinica]|uniref:uncharacterized protein LOC131256819 n=1 Tax=Magnolia sinica TaxID=86752 RepID=UPI002658C169|nr:uncharacterized protein LOC131256819 [Magnolia sinica]